jgi:hypothetical protein
VVLFMQELCNRNFDAGEAYDVVEAEILGRRLGLASVVRACQLIDLD